MKRIALAAAIGLAAALALADDATLPAACAEQGGCLLITQQAFERLLEEIVRLRRALSAPGKGVCA